MTALLVVDSRAEVGRALTYDFAIDVSHGLRFVLVDGYVGSEVGVVSRFRVQRHHRRAR